jgi:hypothetical protein
MAESYKLTPRDFFAPPLPSTSQAGVKISAGFHVHLHGFLISLDEVLFFIARSRTVPVERCKVLTANYRSMESTTAFLVDFPILPAYSTFQIVSVTFVNKKAEPFLNPAFPYLAYNSHLFRF